jgi:hypothetical protein
MCALANLLPASDGLIPSLSLICHISCSHVALVLRVYILCLYYKNFCVTTRRDMISYAFIALDPPQDSLRDQLSLTPPNNICRRRPLMLRTPRSSRSNITDPVLVKEHQRTRHWSFLCDRGNSDLMHQVYSHVTNEECSWSCRYCTARNVESQ